MYKGYNFGNVCGLSVADLTSEQICKIKSRKLAELALLDSRAAIVLGNKIAHGEEDNISSLREYNKDDFDQVPYVVSKYNEFVSRNNDLTGFSPRASYIYWNILDESNRLKELNRYVNNNESVVSSTFTDYRWLVNNKQTDLVNKIISKNLRSRHNIDRIRVMVNIPNECLPLHDKEIFDNPSKIYAYLLSNIEISERYVIKILRSIAGRKRIPKVAVSINKDILRKLPPVTRLKALETLVLSRSKVNFSDITKDELEEMLFTTSMKYTDRVSKILNYMF